LDVVGFAMRNGLFERIPIELKLPSAHSRGSANRDDAHLSRRQRRATRFLLRGRYSADSARVRACYKAAMPLISITRLRVRALRYLPVFSFNALRAARQAKAASGNLAVSLLADANFAFWTRTLWQNEIAVRAFMVSGAHRKMMPRLPEWCDEASVAHWTQDSLEIPSWLQVHERMQAQGRRSKVNHPSEAQQRFEIPVPRTTAELKLK
jgi:hypothetical protein